MQKWFGSHSVQRNAKRFKADKQARHILEWFVGTDYDWLITLDSDLIVRPDWLELLRGMLPHTQGVMSLYHSGNPQPSNSALRPKFVRDEIFGERRCGLVQGAGEKECWWA